MVLRRTPVSTALDKVLPFSTVAALRPPLQLPSLQPADALARSSAAIIALLETGTWPINLLHQHLEAACADLFERNSDRRQTRTMEMRDLGSVEADDAETR